MSLAPTNMKSAPVLRRILIPIASALLVVGCVITAPFDPTALSEAKSLHAASLELMGKATEPYASHASEVSQLRTRLAQAVTAASARPKNQTVVKQWETLTAPDGNLLGGFLKRWEGTSTLGAGFVGEAQKLVGESFQKIIDVEVHRGSH